MLNAYIWLFSQRSINSLKIKCTHFDIKSWFKLCQVKPQTDVSSKLLMIMQNSNTNYSNHIYVIQLTKMSTDVQLQQERLQVSYTSFKILAY